MMNMLSASANGPGGAESTVLPMAIAARGLGRRYGESEDADFAVSDIDFDVPAGQVFGLLGPNGAGKTTLLRMLAAILTPTTGTALIMGKDVREAPLACKRAIGFLSGDTALYARLTARETLAYFAELGQVDEPKARVQHVAQEFDLHDFFDQRISTLSTGQRQRVNLARAFVTDPPVLILDEPTTGLDVISSRFVKEAIDRARRAQKAVILSTHIMSEAAMFCDRIGVLVKGRLRATDTQDNLLETWGVENLAQLIVKAHETPA